MNGDEFLSRNFKTPNEADDDYDEWGMEEDEWGMHFP